MEVEDSPKLPSKAELTKRQELNNHIVLMRKAVRRSRVHLINKLVREAKKLNDRKGPEKAQEKSKRKASRLLEEVAALKNLKEDRVSIHALQESRSLEESLADVNLTPELRALAKLGHHQFVFEEVLKYRSINLHWELQIPVLLEKTKEKLKKSLKKEEKKKLEKENPALQDSDIKKEIESEPESDKELDVDVNPDSPLDIEEANSTQSAPAQKRLSKKQKTVEKGSRKKKLDKVEGTVRIQHLKDLSDLEKPPIKESSAVESRETAKRPRSSFFIGGTEEDEDLHPERRIERPDTCSRLRRERDNPNFENKPIFRKGKLVNKAPTRGFRHAGHGRREIASRTTRSSFENSRGRGTDYQPTLRTGFAKSAPAAVTEKLHPSWEAKKKQTQISLVQPFQGKKIAFTDED